jgi:hypothetical protein
MSIGRQAAKFYVADEVISTMADQVVGIDTAEGEPNVISLFAQRRKWLNSQLRWRRPDYRVPFSEELGDLRCLVVSGTWQLYERAHRWRRAEMRCRDCRTVEDGCEVLRVVGGRELVKHDPSWVYMCIVD